MQALATIEREEQFVTTVGQLCEAATSVVILSREDLSEATDLVKLIKTRYNEIEKERTAIVKPINDSVKTINDRFKRILEPLAEAESDIKGKMLTFQQEEARKAEALRLESEKKAREEAERIAREHAAAKPECPVPLVEVIPVVQPLPPKTTYGQYGAVSSMKKVWAYELLDIKALAAARPDLVVTDAGKISAEIRSSGGDIPGLRIFQKDTIAVR